ncbi:MAG: histidine phosphatase family protein [Bdellovibrionales bacterium]
MDIPDSSISDKQVALILEYKKYLAGKRTSPPGEIISIPQVRSVFSHIENYYLWRHGATNVSERNELAGGVSDEEKNDPTKNISLSRKGRTGTVEFARSLVGRQIKALARKHDSYVATSDLNRAQETAKINLALTTYGMRPAGHGRRFDRLYRAPHVPFETREGLHERRLGKDFSTSASVGRDKLNDITYSPENGENTSTYVRRVVKEFSELAKTAKDEGKKDIFVAGGHSDGLLTSLAILMALGLAEKGQGWDGAIKSYEVLHLTRNTSGKFSIDVLKPKERPSRLKKTTPQPQLSK